MTIIQLFEYLFALCSLIFGAFCATEKVVCAEYREKFAQRLRTFNMKKWGKEWPQEVLNFFDYTFGKKPLTWRFFLRSTVCSTAFYILVVITYTSISSSISSDYGFWQYERYWSIAGWFFVLISVLIFNAVPDYISLLETRWMVGYLAKNPSFLSMVIILLVDLIVTALIFVIYLLLLVIIVWGEDETKDIIFPLFTDTPSPERGVLVTNFHFAFYTTFATSIWVWVYIVGLFCQGLFHNVNSRWLWLRNNFLETKESPFLAVGYTSCLCLSVCGSIIILLYWLYTVITV